ncbi:hypothetical protein [Fredinandcohnia sp. 179-A 10B2 NHS]|uniref:hypothetical protein n=1 Tax=Fredinandcohnia sp. 179-A 10B2 NHS TaxID=3235176 RepID=UPI0039A30C55
MNIYDQCCRYQGRVVNIRCRDGNRHSGRIVRVTRRNVYIEPSGPRSLGGFGLGYWGGYYGGGYGYRPYAIPLAFITGLAIGGLLFW